MSLDLFQPWPNYSEEESKAVAKILLSNKVNYWTGEEGKSFEKEFAHFSGAKYSIALANGTVALELALKALDLKKGDEVIVTSRTYLASVSSIIIAGGIPIFADVDPNSQNITVETIQPLINEKTRGIVCVHLAGWPCDMNEIMVLARQSDLFVIEDCAQAHGAKYNKKSVGSFGDIACWSFCQDKIITTGGEGGMVTTSNKDLWSKMWSYKDHGKSWDAVYKKSHPPGFRWLHESFGSNFRMTEMQAKLGRMQLKKIDAWQKERFNNLESIWEAASESPILRVSKLPENIDHGAYKCYVFLDSNKHHRDTIMKEINSKGVPCFSGSCSEVYLEKAFLNSRFKPKNRLKVAKKLGETSLMFLCHPNIGTKAIAKTCEVIKKVCR